MGSGPCEIQPGNVICLFLGGAVSFVLHRGRSSYPDWGMLLLHSYEWRRPRKLRRFGTIRDLVSHITNYGILKTDCIVSSPVGSASLGDLFARKEVV